MKKGNKMIEVKDKQERMSVEEIMSIMGETVPQDYLDNEDINVSVLQNYIMQSDLPGVVKSDCFGTLLWVAIRCFAFGFESGTGRFFK